MTIISLQFKIEKASWFKGFTQLTTAPRHLDFFGGTIIEKFEQEQLLEKIVK